MIATRVAQNVIRRQMGTSTNRVVGLRAKYPKYNDPAVGAENPTYLKEPGDKVFVALGFTGIAIGVTCVLKGLWSMAFGINKV